MTSLHLCIALALFAQDPEKTLSGHADKVKSVAFSPDGKLLASASADQSILVWDVESGKKLRSLSGHSKAVNGVAFSPDGKTLVSGSEDTSARLWEVESGKELKIFSGHGKAVNAVAFAPDGKTVATAGEDGSVKLWEVESGKTARTLAGGRSGIRAVVFSPDGSKLASGGLILAKVWDSAKGRALQSLKIPASDSDLACIYGHGIAFSPDGSAVVVNGSQGIFLWKVGEQGEPTGIMPTNDGKQGEAWGAAFHPSGKLLAVGARKEVKIWDVETKTDAYTFLGHGKIVTTVAFRPDGKLLASGSDDTTIKLWRIDE